MSTITGKILKFNKWPEGRMIGIAKLAADALSSRGFGREAILFQLEGVRSSLGTFLGDPLFADLVRECIMFSQKDDETPDVLRHQPIPYPVWGRDAIDKGAIQQMDNAMSLSVCVSGALMPDAHSG